MATEFYEYRGNDEAHTVTGQGGSVVACAQNASDGIAIALALNSMAPGLATKLVEAIRTATLATDDAGHGCFSSDQACRVFTGRCPDTVFGEHTTDADNPFGG